jgi:aminopeptidase N
MIIRRLLPFLLATAACTGRDAPETTPAPAARDIHSYAIPAEARVTHVSLDLIPDFDSKRIGGTARLAIERGENGDSIVLDIDDLAIKRVSMAGSDTLPFRVGADDPNMGQPLIIQLPAQGDTIVIEYETSPDASAVQWLDPAQTAGGRLPFLFTQGQAILTRSWVPTQDSPGIRQTYDARIHVPAGMKAVMSAELLTPDGEPGTENRVAYRFKLDQAVPPYLIALAVGDLAFREIGPRSGVWAEPSVAERAASEFNEVEQMMDAAEKLYGPYRWGRYDILVLPPSFPFGGMENPRLTFATPTVLAGDRSLVSLIAHELAHSWSGNLVTNATWADFWLNEGFTTYIEARIMEELRGADYADMLRQLGREDLTSTIEDMGATSPDTRLHIDLAGRNPDDGMTSIAYEKGSAFLQTVESVVGRQRLDAFLRQYFDAHAFQPMTAQQFVAYMNEHLFENEQEAAQVNAQQWIFEPGLPDNVPQITPTRFTAVDQQVTAFRNGTAPSQLQTRNWSTQEWLRFLRALPDTMSTQQMTALDQAFNFTRSGNSEILFEWFRSAIRNRYEPAMPALERFLTTQGRRKFIAPLFQDLMDSGWGAARAREIYGRARPTYHAVTRNTVDGIVR